MFCYKKRSYMVVLIALLVLFTLITGCSKQPSLSEKEETGGGSNANEAFASLPEIKMTLAHADTADPTMQIQATALAFKEYVEEESQGKIQVEISPGGALGNSASLLEQVMTGELEASLSQTEGTIASVYPNIQVLAIPYVFDHIDQALEVMRGEFGQAMFEEMRQQTGIRVIGIWDSGGFRHFTNNRRSIRTPEDMKGLKIRTMDIPAHMKLVECLGAVPTPVAWSELYSALETGVVDGQTNAAVTVILGSIHEVQKYMILDGSGYTQQHMVVSDEWFKELPEEYQEIILLGGEKAQIAGERAVRIWYRDIGMPLLKARMEVYEPTAKEIQQFKDLTQRPVAEYIREAIDDPTWVDKILEAAETAKEKLGYKHPLVTN